ncbi:hypothetical protein ACP70R_021907 [Stipagrostis hirtigluma subsp. patula]
MDPSSAALEAQGDAAGAAREHEPEPLPPDEFERLEASFRRPRVPVVAQLNHLYLRARDGDGDGDGEARGGKRPRLAASDRAVRGIREVRAGDAAQEECAVCLQDFGAEETLRAMPCSHAFHQGCIFGWLRTNHVCPLCRHALPHGLQEDDEEKQQ